MKYFKKPSVNNPKNIPFLFSVCKCFQRVGSTSACSSVVYRAWRLEGRVKCLRFVFVRVSLSVCANYMVVTDKRCQSRPGLGGVGIREMACEAESRSFERSGSDVQHAML